MTAHFIGGNIANQYNSASAQVSTGALYPGLAAALGDPNGTHLSQIIMVQGGDSQTTAAPGVPFSGPAGLSVFNGTAVPISVAGGTIAPGAAIPGAVLAAARNSIFNRNAIGWNIRANFGFDLASNTAYGPLIGHFDLNSDLGSGLDSPSLRLINTGI
jgi:hypothetical protein